MDYKKLYTPSEATALYNLAKIRYDPTSYSLRGNLITSCDTDELRSEHISYFDYRTEEKLLDLIDENDGIPSNSYTGITCMKSTLSYDAKNEPSTAFVQQDNLYVNVSYLAKLVDPAHLKRVMPMLVTMCIALNSNKSCAKELLYLAFTETKRLEYSEVCVMEPLRKALEDKTMLYTLSADTGIDCSFVPTWGSEGSISSFTKYSTEQIAVNTLYAYVAASFEVLWAWNKMPTEFREMFERLCITTNRPTHDTELFKRFFTVTSSGIALGPELEEAISIDNPEKRYEAYQKLMNDPSIYADCEDYYPKMLTLHLLNPMIMLYAAFILQISTVSIRINTIRILYDYCVTNGYLEDSDEEVGEVDVLSSADAEFLAKSAGAPLTAAPPESKELMPLDRKKHSSGVATGGGSYDETPMFEALDKMKASFKSGGYSFDVKDVIDTSSKYRDAYEAVAKKVETVNKLLTRRIKDIKTYNVGGKNPGVRSGRVDRKAVYRYRYDPNIFYNNTYKTLESDLAFGIVLDESGSMCGSGIEDGRITMIVLHETLKALGINHSIVGHTSEDRHHTQIARYQAFKEDKTYTTCKNYAIVSTKAKSGNCDSGALYYMEKALDRVRNKDKICLIFSDGSPTECTGTELKNQVKRMEKKGIKVIGIGINFESISKYYSDYANGRNLTDMLNIVSKILEEYVLKKKG